MSVQDDVSNTIRPIIEASGNYLEEVKVVAAGKRKLITIIVDGDTYLNLDQVTQITKSISEEIDNLKALGDGAFTLEVTSPGTDRPLTLPRHWKKNIGKLVKIIQMDGSQAAGRIIGSNDLEVELDSTTIKFSEIKKAQLEIEFKK